MLKMNHGYLDEIFNAVGFVTTKNIDDDERVVDLDELLYPSPNKC